jgi:hypothetical protein
MRSMLLTAFAAVTVGIFAPSALAKGQINLCGASACAPLSSGDWVGGLVDWDSELHLSSPAAPSRYYEIRYAETTKPLGYWIPSTGVLRLRDDYLYQAIWVTPDQGQLTLLAKAAAGLDSFAAPTAAQAWVNGRRVKSARGYLDLFSLGTSVSSWTGAKGWLNVYVRSRAESPWSDGANSLWVSRKGGWLKRDGQVLRIPIGLARRIRGRLPLSA